jgi:myosin heavy subunit
MTKYILSNTLHSQALHANGKSPALIIPRIKRSNVEFGIRHYAGDVLYDATDFVTKNQVSQFFPS